MLLLKNLFSHVQGETHMQACAQDAINVQEDLKFLNPLFPGRLTGVLFHFTRHWSAQDKVGSLYLGGLHLFADYSDFWNFNKPSLRKAADSICIYQGQEPLTMYFCEKPAVNLSTQLTDPLLLWRGTGSSPTGLLLHIAWRIPGMGIHEDNSWGWNGMLFSAKDYILHGKTCEFSHISLLTSMGKGGGLMELSATLGP